MQVVITRNAQSCNGRNWTIKEFIMFYGIHNIWVQQDFKLINSLIN